MKIKVEGITYEIEKEDFKTLTQGKTKNKLSGEDLLSPANS